MIFRSLFAFLITISIVQASQPGTSDKQDITHVLSTQVLAWNNGDIPSFMLGYTQSESLRFASGGNITYGWQQTLDGYLKRYPDTKTMGKLRFNDLNITIMGTHHALVFGRWSLQRENDRPNGLFTLTFQKNDGQWKIIHDHTSSAKD